VSKTAPRETANAINKTVAMSGETAFLFMNSLEA
jgi:hypothetical protein